MVQNTGGLQIATMGGIWFIILSDSLHDNYAMNTTEHGVHEEGH
jgi:hypothetical protein